MAAEQPTLSASFKASILHALDPILDAQDDHGDKSMMGVAVYPVEGGGVVVSASVFDLAAFIFDRTGRATKTGLAYIPKRIRNSAGLAPTVELRYPDFSHEVPMPSWLTPDRVVFGPGGVTVMPLAPHDDVDQSSTLHAIDTASVTATEPSARFSVSDRPPFIVPDMGRASGGIGSACLIVSPQAISLLSRIPALFGEKNVAIDEFGSMYRVTVPGESDFVAFVGAGCAPHPVPGDAMGWIAGMEQPKQVLTSFQ